MAKWSLETKDSREAAKAWPAALKRWEREVADWERLGRVETITPSRALELAALWVARIEGGEPLPIVGDNADSDIFDPICLPQARTPDGLAAMFACVERHAAEALVWAGITATPASLPVLIDAMVMPVASAYLQVDLRGIGATTAGPAVMPLRAIAARLPTVPLELANAAQAAPDVTITKLYDRWAKVSATKPRTVTEAKYHVDDLKRFVGHDDAARLTTSDVRKWRDAMTERGLNNNTVNARFSAVRQVLKRAFSDQLIATNPADAALRLPKAAARSWLPYSSEDACLILAAARKEPGPSRRWAHWIMAFTGMRVGEVLQLVGRDVRQDGEVWHFVVSEDDPTATVKNGMIRHVPIHPALIAEGFLKFAEAAAADAPLFPDKKLDLHGNRGGRAWQKVGRWVRDTVGIKNPRQAPDHSWRHYFEDALRTAEVPRDVRDAIIGHAEKSVGRMYGVKGEALARLARGVAAVRSPFDDVAPLPAG